MIVRTKFGGNVELRSEFGNSSNIRPPWSAYVSSSGLPVTNEQTFGLPAVANVITSAAEIIAALPFITYTDGDIRERAPDTWQYQLLHDRPNERCDSFEFFYDVVVSLEATQNAFIQKAKFGERVYALYVLDPQRIVVRQDRESGRKRFDYYASETNVRRNLSDSEILHIRGRTPTPGGFAGVSLIQQHRDPLGAQIAMQRFEGDYFRNNSVPPIVFNLGPNGNVGLAGELLDGWDAQHAGPGKQFKAGAVWAVEGITTLPISMKDASFVESKSLSIEDACRIWRWPRDWIGLADTVPAPDVHADMAKNLKLYLAPRLKRIERAFAADDDLYWNSGLLGEFLTEGLERADVLTRYQAYKDGRQGSWITANEIRRLENLPPMEGGDEIQQTPVGGAPNPGSVEEPAAA